MISAETHVTLAGCKECEAAVSWDRLQAFQAIGPRSETAPHCERRGLESHCLQPLPAGATAGFVFARDRAGLPVGQSPAAPAALAWICLQLVHCFLRFIAGAAPGRPAMRATAWRKHMKRFAAPRDGGKLPRPLFGTALSLALCGVLLGTARPALGQDDKLPKGDELLDKYIEATGGKAAYKKINNRVTKATFDVPMQGLKGAITIYAARPNLLYSVVELPGGLKQESGTDGEVAWQRTVMGGAQILEGEPRTEFMRQAMFDSEVNWRKLYKKAETVGVEEVEGRPAYKVELTIDDENKMTACYDKESYLMVKTVMTNKSPMGDVPVETLVRDYRKVGDILVAHRMQQKMTMMGQTLEQVLTFDSVKVNTKIDKDRFALPDDVKELVKQQKEEKKDQAP